MKFLKTLICVALAVVITISAFSVSAAAAQEGRIKQGVGYITASSLRLRSGPSTGSNTLAYGYQNEAVILLGKTGQWYHVLYNLTEGYMHESYLRTSKIENAELGYGIVNYTKVNMRTGPSTAYSRIGQSSQGDLAYVVGLNNGWYKVIWNDNICYIRSDYLTLTEVPYENRANPHAPLFFRSGKSTGTPVIVRAPQDDLTATKKIIEMGVDGIIFPMVRTAEEANRVIASTLYPPYGDRGFGPMGAIDYGMEYSYSKIR